LNGGELRNRNNHFGDKVTELAAHDDSTEARVRKLRAAIVLRATWNLH
jgi:hypothetical protein